MPLYRYCKSSEDTKVHITDIAPVTPGGLGREDSPPSTTALCGKLNVPSSVRFMSMFGALSNDINDLCVTCSGIASPT